MSSEEANSRMLDLERQIAEQSSEIHTLKIEIQQKEEQIFFEKQKGSLG